MNFFNTLVYSNRIGIRIFRHVLFWVTDIVNYLMVVSINTEITPAEVSKIILRIPFVILITYFILYYLIPRFSKQNDKGQLFLWIVAVLAFLGIGIRYYKLYVVFPLSDPSQAVNYEIWDFRRIISEIFAWMAVISIAIAIKVIKNRTELQQKNEQLMNEKKVAELNFLKAQMHPHFLFNTLNTLYSETIQDTGKAEQVVLHLSNLLRFILDECDKPLIAIQKEIKVIQDYIQLEKLRYNSRLKVNLSVLKVDPDLLISPLIFLPFIENSFKHSLNNLRGDININIEISFKDNRFYLLVDNDNNKAVKPIEDHAFGKGIANVRRQLELLYGKEYALTIDDEQNKYRVSLMVPAKQGFEND